MYAEVDRHRRRYRRLVFQAGRLVGVTRVGAVEQAGIYFQIMAQKLPVAQLPADPRGGGFIGGFVGINFVFKNQGHCQGHQ